MSPNSSEADRGMLRRRATREELREGARQITEAHIRMQLEASEVPIEGSPAAGLHEEPMTIPPLELLPDPAQGATEADQRMDEGREKELQRMQVRPVEGPGKGKGVRSADGKPEGEQGMRTPQRTSERRQEIGDTHGLGSQTPLFNDEQLRRFQAIYQRAPWLYPEERQRQSRPQWMEEEEKIRRRAEEQMRRWEERQKEDEMKRAIEESRRKDEELQRLREKAMALERENASLKMKDAQEWGQSSQFVTPEEPQEAPKVVRAVGEDLMGDGPRVEGAKGDDRDHQTHEQEEGNPEGLQGLLCGMMKLMQGMQAMQTQILDVKRQKDLEVVKSGIAELPRLQEWKPDTAPLDLTDWLLSIEPAMGDLSDGSQQWWDGMLCAARSWYSMHLEKTPLERVGHRPEVPPELKEPRYQRLEKRVAALLMSAIPQSQQEEVIAGKEITTISILGKLMLSYQPGGLTEKAAILHALDSPEEAQGMTQAVMGLRRWLRWHRRAGEVGVVRPDATI